MRELLKRWVNTEYNQSSAIAPQTTLEYFSKGTISVRDMSIGYFLALHFDNLSEKEERFIDILALVLPLAILRSLDTVMYRQPFTTS